MKSQGGEESVPSLMVSSMKIDGMYDPDNELILGSVDEVAGIQKIWDDISGQELDYEIVKRARAEEMKEFKKHNVYTKVPIEECIQEAGNKPIGHRWVDIDKGDRNRPNYRSRLVAK